MSDSAISKTQRAHKHIQDIIKLFEEEAPFTYVMTTNIKTGERCTRSKKNNTIITEACGIAGDAVHNLRSALDHAYFDIVKEFATGPRGIKNIQFPFSETKAGLKTAVKNRLAHKVSDNFFNAVMELKPHGETGGNKTLYLIHQIDALDKHRFPVPIADYKDISSDRILKEVPHYPNSFTNIIVGGSGIDVSWRFPVMPSEDVGAPIPPNTFMFEKKLEVPVGIVFNVSSNGQLVSMIPTLNKMASITQNAINIIKQAAP